MIQSQLQLIYSMYIDLFELYLCDSVSSFFNASFYENNLSEEQRIKLIQDYIQSHQQNYYISLFEPYFYLISSTISFINNIDTSALCLATYSLFILYGILQYILLLPMTPIDPALKVWLRIQINNEHIHSMTTHSQLLAYYLTVLYGYNSERSSMVLSDYLSSIHLSMDSTKDDNSKFLQDNIEREGAMMFASLYNDLLTFSKSIMSISKLSNLHLSFLSNWSSTSFVQSIQNVYSVLLKSSVYNNYNLMNSNDSMNTSSSSISALIEQSDIIESSCINMAQTLKSKYENYEDILQPINLSLYVITSGLKLISSSFSKEMISSSLSKDSLCLIQYPLSIVMSDTFYEHFTKDQFDSLRELTESKSIYISILLQLVFYAKLMRINGQNNLDEVYSVIYTIIDIFIHIYNKQLEEEELKV